MRLQPTAEHGLFVPEDQCSDLSAKRLTLAGINFPAGLAVVLTWHFMKSQIAFMIPL